MGIKEWSGSVAWVFVAFGNEFLCYGHLVLVTKSYCMVYEMQYGGFNSRILDHRLLCKTLNDGSWNF